MAKVIPIHKTGANYEFNYYRSNFLKFLTSYLMIDWKNSSVRIIFYQTANLVFKIADLAWQLSI